MNVIILKTGSACLGLNDRLRKLSNKIVTHWKIEFFCQQSEFKIPVPRRSNRRPDGDQPCKQHSDRALSLMLLGDFETGLWARSAVSALATRRQPQLAGDCGVWHGSELISTVCYCHIVRKRAGQLTRMACFPFRGQYSRKARAIKPINPRLVTVQPALIPGVW